MPSGGPVAAGPVIPEKKWDAVVPLRFEAGEPKRHGRFRGVAGAAIWSGGQIKLKDVAPFAGLGFDNTFTRSSRWGFRALAGVAWSDEPEVGLESTGGSLSNDPTFRARLAEERASIQSDVEDYGFYPVLQLGLNYKF